MLNFSDNPYIFINVKYSDYLKLIVLEFIQTILKRDLIELSIVVIIKVS